MHIDMHKIYFKNVSGNVMDGKFGNDRSWKTTVQWVRQLKGQKGQCHLDGDWLTFRP